MLRELEQDLATNITHGSVKQYCRYLRGKKDRLSASYKLLYDNFVKVEDNQNKSVKGLFEKYVIFEIVQYIDHRLYIQRKEEKYIHLRI